MKSLLERWFHLSAAGTTVRTELLAGLLMLSGLFFAPLAQMIGEGALVVVGTFMMRNVGRIPWDDPQESLPAFATIAFISFTFSITDGIAFGFIVYVLLSLASGRARKLHWLMVVFTLLFILRYVALGAI